MSEPLYWDLQRYSERRSLCHLLVKSARMVKASGHIEQQLSRLQDKTAGVATELENLVDQYLQVLSQASKRQLVLAAYHICTQVYPDKFLDLSFSQRDSLQKQLRDLGNSIQPQLNEKWETAKRLSLRPAEEDGLAVIRQLFLEAAAAQDQTEQDDSKPQTADQPSARQDTAAVESSVSKRPQDKLLTDIRSLITSDAFEPSPPEQEPPGPMQPAQLMRRQILVEKAIRDVFKAVSEKANELLRKADIMPEIPQALINAASESERLGHIPMKTPNLVRLSIKVLHEPSKDRLEKTDDDSSELEDDADSKQWSEAADISAAIISGQDSVDEEDTEDTEELERRSEETLAIPRFLQLESLPDFVMIHLRLAEIEFAETNVAAWRSRIRKEMAHLKQIGYAYKDAERQLAIAQAEDAWRASWTNE